MLDGYLKVNDVEIVTRRQRFPYHGADHFANQITANLSGKPLTKIHVEWLKSTSSGQAPTKAASEAIEKVFDMPKSGLQELFVYKLDAGVALRESALHGIAQGSRDLKCLTIRSMTEVN